MDIIKRWDTDEELLFPQFNEYIEDTTLQEKPIDLWRDKIKTCKFDCWDCNYCDSVIHSRMRKNERTMDKDIELVLNSIDKAVRRESKFVEEGYYDLLSEASKLSLEAQGGPFTEEEAKIFVEKPFMKEAIELRRFDDQAKILNKKTPSLDYFKHYVEEAHNLFLNN